MKFVILFATLGLLLSVQGCGASKEFKDLEAKMDEVKSRPKGRIEPPPEFQVYRAFSYSAAVLRSPFEKPIAVELAALPRQRSSVVPDFDRPKEVLEHFSIDGLSMVGTLRRPGGSLYALIRDTEAGLHRVSSGNYMGRNFGKVIDITQNKIDVIEIVSDGQDGWVERPRTIVLRDQ